MARWSLRQWWSALFKQAPPAISQEQAIALARAECERRGWRWVEPANVERHGNRWLVRTNYPNRGTNAIVEVDAQTGAIVHAGYVPR